MYKLKENIQYELLEESGIIVDANNGKFLSINRMGFCILRAIDVGATKAEIILALETRFPESKNMAKQIVVDFFDKLEAEQIITQKE